MIAVKQAKAYIHDVKKIESSEGAHVGTSVSMCLREGDGIWCSMYVNSGHQQDAFDKFTAVKGKLVVVTGELTGRSYVIKDGDKEIKRTGVSFTATEPTDFAGISAGGVY